MNIESVTKEKIHRQLQVLTFCGVTITAFLFTIALAKLKAILVPLMIAVLIYITLIPLVRMFVVKLKTPRFLAMTLSLFLVSLFLFLLGLAFNYSLNEFSDNQGLYKYKISVLIAEYKASYLGQFFGFANNFDDTQLANLVQSFSLGAIGFASNVTLVFIFLIFILSTKKPRKADNPLLVKIQNSLARYILIKTFISFVTATLLGVFFQIIGLEMALTFTILVLLLNFIPNLGSIVATLIPLPIAYLQFGLGFDFLLVLLIPGFTQLILGNFVEPMLMGDNLGLHPIIILSSLIFWGIVWGLAGMFLAVPITVIIKIICAEVKELRFITSLLEGNILEFLKLKTS